MTAALPDPTLAGRFSSVANPGSAVLYRSSSGLEKSIADTEADRIIKVADWVISDQWDPYLISSNNLPYLAWAMGVNLWENIWSDPVKRDWVAQQWTFKSVRGTIAAVRMALAPSGYMLTDYVSPPQGFFASPDLTKDEMDAWIRQMPEIRIQYAVKHGTHGLDEFFIGDDTADYGFVGQDALPLDDGFALRGRVAVLRHNGVDTPMEIIEYHSSAHDADVVDYERLSTIGQSTLGFFVGDAFVNESKFIDFAEQEANLITLRLDRQYNHDDSNVSLTMVTPSLVPITPRYEINSDIGNGGPFFFLNGDFLDDRFLDNPDGGDKLLADRVYLLDPDVTEPMTEGVSFIDQSRIGMPSYTVELQIDLRLKELVKSVFIETSFAGDAFLVPQDNTDIERAYRAVIAAKAERDTALISFAPKRPLQLGDVITDDMLYSDWITELL